jgi:hypothetical protein
MRRRTWFVALGAAAVFAAGAWAQDGPMPVPPEQLRPIAELIAMAAGEVKDPPVTVAPDPERALGFRVEENAGLVLLPDKNLTADALKAAGEKPLPVAVAVMRGASVADAKGLVTDDRRQTITIRDRPVGIFWLAARKNGENLVLEVYSKGGKPLITSPLRAANGDAKVPVGLAFENLDTTTHQADRVVTLAGAQRAPVRVGLE